jgi:hypothetical protein
MLFAGAGSIADAPPEMRQINKSLSPNMPTARFVSREAANPLRSGTGWPERKTSIESPNGGMYWSFGATKIPFTLKFLSSKVIAVIMGTAALPTARISVLFALASGTELSPHLIWPFLTLTFASRQP